MHKRVEDIDKFEDIVRRTTPADDNDDVPQALPVDMKIEDIEKDLESDKKVETRTMKLGAPLKIKHTEEQIAIINAFKHAWKEYRLSAWGLDEVKPISHRSSTWFNLGLTIVDSLDTMWLMGLDEEFNEAKKWVEHSMVLDQNKDVNLFETTIRVLGGLLSTYHLTKDSIFLDKAVIIHFVCCV